MRNTKTGDVFSVTLDNGSRKYFQYVISDLSQLNSDVILAFKKVYEVGDGHPDLSEIVAGEVEFYAHCVTKAGLKLGLWELVGNIKDVGNTHEILFRDSKDYGQKIDGKRIEISENWFVWHVNEEFRFVGKLEGVNRKAEIGVIPPPSQIVERIKSGRYTISYPGFE